MELHEITREAACNSILAFASEGRLVQGAWHDVSKDGRQLACLLGSIHTGIDDPGKCPAAVMPEWMAELLVTLFDGVSEDKALHYGIRFSNSLRVGNTDESVLRRWLVIAVEDAIKSATPTAEITPDYWQRILVASSKVVALLQSNASKAKLRAATAECSAVRAAARAAADAAMYAAEGAVRAAADAAADAAGAACYERLFDALICEMQRNVGA